MSLRVDRVTADIIHILTFLDISWLAALIRLGKSRVHQPSALSLKHNFFQIEAVNIILTKWQIHQKLIIKKQQHSVHDSSYNMTG